MKISPRELRRIIKEEVSAASSLRDTQVYGHGGSARMARSQLFQIAKRAQSLHDRLNDNDELPEWVQSKIAVMEANMDTVADHLEYKMQRPPPEEEMFDFAGDVDELIQLVREE